MTGDAVFERILVLAPRGRDAELTCDLLTRAGLQPLACRDGAHFVAAFREGAACAVITQEAMGPGMQAELGRVLDAQPPWSDFPLIFLAGHAQPTQIVDLGNITVLERPVSPTTLLAAVRTALRGRKRQYEARAAIQQRDQFLAMLGHELRNPLGAIVLASEGWLERTPELSAKHFQLIARQAGHLTRLVDDLLDVARVTSGKVRLQREAVDTVTLIQNCIASLQRRIADHEITVSTNLTPAIIEADPVRLEQIINNLLTNAIKYSPKQTKVTITTATRGQDWVLRIRDEGIGIAPEMLARVFELFAQAESSLARAEGGMGIGLTLVDRLARLHGGHVHAESGGPGKGSEFTVTIPIGHAQRTEAAPVSITSDRLVNVVLVEDNPDLRELSKMMLENLGCQVEVAADGTSGLDLILDRKPALAIVDIGLPGLDGFDIAQRVRRSLGNSLLMVAVTGYGQRYDRDRALASGFDAHITKPLRMTAIHSMIDRARAQSAAIQDR
jgi:signal transduction histidine kinase/ActR/RegA family two-component response regulator